MSVWKHSFELVTRELEISRKKKQALDNLYATDKISQSTYSHLGDELAKAVTELEDHLNSLKDKMTERSQELERQIGSLELFLASLELHHAVGDVDNETYEKQNKAILLGLEATKQELNEIKSSLQKTAPSQAEPEATPTAPATPVTLEPEATTAEEVPESETIEEPLVEEETSFGATQPVEESSEASGDVSSTD